MTKTETIIQFLLKVRKGTEIPSRTSKYRCFEVLNKHNQPVYYFVGRGAALRRNLKPTSSDSFSVHYDIDKMKMYLERMPS